MWKTIRIGCPLLFLFLRALRFARLGGDIVVALHEVSVGQCLDLLHVQLGLEVELLERLHHREV